MIREMIVLFGRLNLIANYDDKGKYLLTSLQADKQINVREFDWGFFDVSEFEYEDQRYILGNLVKYKSKLTEEFVDKQTRRTTNTQINDRVVAKSEFILHIKSGLIAYHTINNHITHQQFQKFFAELVEAANDYLLVNAEIQSINEQNEILEAIQKFETINRLTIYLHPSNPRFSDRWEKVDKKLKAMSAHSYRAIYQTQSSLAIEADEDAMSEIYMAVDGYGRATVHGTKNGKSATASTVNAPMKQNISLSEDPKEMLTGVLDKFREIWDRMTKSEM
jgi:hypothetical protein